MEKNVYYNFDFRIVPNARLFPLHSKVGVMKPLLTKITILETIDYKDIVFILSLVNKYINTLHSRVHSSFVYHCNNNWMIGNANNYRPNPCVVEIFGGTWISHHHALVTFKGRKPYSLVICLRGFHWPTGCSVCFFFYSHERLFLYVLTPWLEFVVAVELLLSIRIHNFVSMSLTP